MEYIGTNKYAGLNLNLNQQVRENSYLLNKTNNSSLVNNSNLQESYKKNNVNSPINGSENLLERLAEGKTNIDKSKDAYSLDNCHCPPCGCLKANLALVLSPAGVATATTIFAGSSVM